ncbi:TetR/AcrR family transcriptional regulator [Mycetocola sp. JXN-3]|uniref:TetR/AcrR family transcriptional regulator n=1 Tax=Mycetocola sp. JXN-3 TaxID=2116510 RepID=UPI00165CF64D|nr:TetR/AcrR family transcriptional regulator [Mycetocola sp. JXN-3]
METTGGSRRLRQRRELERGIVDEAMRLLRAGGVPAVSLRGIARALGMSAPAIYTYFPSLTELITELIVRCTDSLTEALRGAMPEQDARPLDQRLLAGPLAYREWALTHRSEFNLIFFDQVIGYAAPEGGVTVAAQSRMLHVLAGPFAALRGVEADALEAREDFLDEFLGWWGSFHGLVALEVNHHLDWRDPQRIFLAQVKAGLTLLGRVPKRR